MYPQVQEFVFYGATISVSFAVSDSVMLADVLRFICNEFSTSGQRRKDTLAVCRCKYLVIMTVSTMSCFVIFKHFCSQVVCVQSVMLFPLNLCLTEASHMKPLYKCNCGI